MSFAVCGRSLFCVYCSIKEKLPAEVLALMDASILFVVNEGTYC